MNWDAVGAIAELLGAIGVIGSLIYVASQVRASTVASKVESKLRLTENMVNFGDLLISSPELNELMIDGRKGLDSLSKGEYLQFSNLALNACWYLSSGFFMYQQKSINDDDWYELRTIAIYWSNSKGFQEWWAKRGRFSFTGKFAEFIDQEIEFANNSK
ncbi:MAG: hypothetical protein ACI9FB_003865 [Candidatus Azotimanducaceae bacterium]|jgi:hypothetical protein